MPNRERELTPKASAPLAASPMTMADASSAPELARIRRHASPISAISSVRIAFAMVEAASSAAARAGATARTAATPAMANVAGW